MDRDMINIIHYLYHRGTISDDAAHRMLGCPHDTVAPLKDSLILATSGSDWTLSPGVVDFIRRAEENMRSFPLRDWVFNYPMNVPPAPGAPRDCFVLMPYGKNWSQPVYDSIARSARAARYTCGIARDIANTGGIMQQIWESVRKADAIVADLTDNNSNVLYETGIAHALGKEVVLITQDVNSLPFDLRALRCIQYRESDLVTLERELQLFLQSIPQRY
jgi:hypothetical protein